MKSSQKSSSVLLQVLPMPFSSSHHLTSDQTWARGVETHHVGDLFAACRKQLGVNHAVMAGLLQSQTNSRIHGNGTVSGLERGAQRSNHQQENMALVYSRLMQARSGDWWNEERAEVLSSLYQTALATKSGVTR